jgi:hypothetical protein
MILIGADTHKDSHTLAAVDAAIGQVLTDVTVRARRRSFEDRLVWARELGGERVWAIEDCRHVSGALERFLLVHDRCLPHPQASRRQNPTRSAALPQASPRPPRLATAPTRCRPARSSHFYARHDPLQHPREGALP